MGEEKLVINKRGSIVYNRYYEIDSELRKNVFLERHYECLPYIGERYEKSRLLLVGESHYIPQNAIGLVKRNDFYEIALND